MITILTLVFELSGLRANFSVENLRNLIEANPIQGTIIFMGLFALGNIVQVPGWIFLAAAVITLGKINGGLVTYAAAIASCLITYSLVRTVGKDALRGMQSPLAIGIFNKLDRHPIMSIILLRTFFQTVPVLNYSLAMAGIRYRDYLLGTVLGLPFPILLYCVFFDFLAKNIFQLTAS